MRSATYRHENSEARKQEGRTDHSEGAFGETIGKERKDDGEEEDDSPRQ